MHFSFLNMDQDITRLNLAYYRRKRKGFPNLPKSSVNVHQVVDQIETQNNKEELCIFPFFLNLSQGITRFN